ncbi:related to HOL1 protein [Ramularia collo-cygni]|uniref:Related to HOL1 protein n=1 Tax=Ramularia collo-cygni TaxID=112498 RepID=A0A2D3UQA0_9PEZI|nr:related to HOL1 protein [Ramularia collo-cygni]CZT17841.1 related to HOL1 protein [Ramularia collo-cygni]
MATPTKDRDAAMDHLEFIDEKATNKHSNAQVNGNINLLDDQGDVRRIPIPSSDPNDPLNMHKWRKLGVLISCCWYSIFSLVLVGGAGPILPFWIQEYASSGRDVTEIVKLTTYPSLVMAFGAFLILPLSIVFGRRPVLLGCCLLLLGSTIGAGLSQSYEAHMACRILQGVATGAAESVLPLVITDVSFLDERGLLFGFYWGTQSCVNAIFTITVSYLAADLGWRWFYWLLTILVSLNFLLLFFCLPETRYARSPMSIRGQEWHTDEFGVTRVISSQQAQAQGRLTASTIPEISSDNVLGGQKKKRSYWQELHPISSVAPNGFRIGFGVIVKMLSALSSPAVIWAIFATSISLGVGISMSLTYGLILTENYTWSQSSVGLVNCGILPAALLAMFWAGWGGDKTNLWLAKRRNGVHHPEDTLVILICPTLVSGIGIVVYALAAARPEGYSSWGIIMGWTLLQFGFIVCIITTTHFAAEAYPSNPGPALVLVVGVKNIVSFGQSVLESPSNASPILPHWHND